MKTPIRLTQAECRACHAGTWAMLVLLGFIGGWLLGQREWRFVRLEQANARTALHLSQALGELRTWEARVEERCRP